MALCLFLFIYSVLLSLICTYIPGVCNFLHLVLLVVRFVVIHFYVLSFVVSSICKCVICSNRKKGMFYHLWTVNKMFKLLFYSINHV